MLRDHHAPAAAPAITRKTRVKRRTLRETPVPNHALALTQSVARNKQPRTDIKICANSQDFNRLGVPNLIKARPSPVPIISSTQPDLASKVSERKWRRRNGKSSSAKSIPMAACNKMSVKYGMAGDGRAKKKKRLPLKKLSCTRAKDSFESIL